MGRRPFPWFKFWPDILRNPKIRGLTLQQSRDWLFFLCAASEQKKRWHFSDDRTAAMIVGIPVGRLRRMIELRLIDRVDDGICVHDYKDWQEVYPSDLARSSLGIDSEKTPQRGERGEGRGERGDSYYESLRDSGLSPRQFFEKRLEESQNKNAVVGETFEYAFNRRPDYGRLGKLSKTFGGELRVIQKTLSLSGHLITRDPHDYLQICLKRAESGESREPPDLYPPLSVQLHDRLLADDAAGIGEEPEYLREDLKERRTSGKNGAPE